MTARFAEHPDAVAETVRLAERLRFDLTTELGYRYPQEDDADRTLAELCRARLADRYEGEGHRGAAEARLEGELGTIRRLDLSGFFLLPPSPARARPRGRGRGAGTGGGPRPAAARARAWLQASARSSVT